MAEGEGFEPSVGILSLLRFSKPPDSASLAPFHAYESTINCSIPEEAASTTSAAN